MLARDAMGEAPPVKRNPYAEAADPERYRVADVPLFTCAEHADACVLCTTAGKNGRNGRTAAVGATLFWLTCPHLNALIARLEGHRCVQAVTEAMKKYPCLTTCHVRSHEVYAARARLLLTDAQWSFFTGHFLSTENAQQHKFGNAAVGHAEDMKCLHALVAQTLAAAENPVGSLLVNYLLFLYHLTCIAEDEVARSEEKRTDLRAVLDSRELLVHFMEAFLACMLNENEGDGHTRTVKGIRSATFTVSMPEPHVFEMTEVAYEWQLDSSFAALTPDVCARALRVLIFLEGKPPRRHKKHRIN
ncbi:hypothetical protein ABL78_2932 [Leptomonas seymouri]|uniref:Uncharacterized protein n=1 Tax=Leptomonas seymouri TaxID=5684 RepID=A0A0N0P6T1_LEPSE|nr:hypothetical protein ABL78_2932 [Leptomonas seymouri]|eukprot:KPI87996.1 hypothetical protein ABL78_2932 [Leptomonas seymouri]